MVFDKEGKTSHYYYPPSKSCKRESEDSEELPGLQVIQGYHSHQIYHESIPFREIFERRVKLWPAKFCLSMRDFVNL